MRNSVRFSSVQNSFVLLTMHCPVFILSHWYVTQRTFCELHSNCHQAKYCLLQSSSCNSKLILLREKMLRKFSFRTSCSDELFRHFNFDLANMIQTLVNCSACKLIQLDLSAVLTCGVVRATSVEILGLYSKLF